jgi:hypothetical protein
MAFDKVFNSAIRPERFWGSFARSAPARALIA